MTFDISFFFLNISILLSNVLWTGWKKKKKRNLAKDANSTQHVLVPNLRSATQKYTKMDLQSHWRHGQTSMSDTCQVKKKKSFAWILCLSYLTPELQSPVVFFFTTKLHGEWQAASSLKLVQHNEEHSAVWQKGLLTNKMVATQTTCGDFIFLSWFSCHCIIGNYVAILHSCYGFSMTSPPSVMSISPWLPLCFFVIECPYKMFYIKNVLLWSSFQVVFFWYSIYLVKWMTSIYNLSHIALNLH